MIFAITSAAFALTCDPGDDLCNDVDAMQSIVNDQFSGNPVNDTVAQRYLDGLSGAQTALLDAGCTMDTYAAGKWRGRQQVLSGASESGDPVFGSLTNGEFTGGFGTTVIGDSFSDLARASRFIANIGDDGIAVGIYTRVSGRTGTFMTLTATCDAGTPPGPAIMPWFGPIDGDFGAPPPVFAFSTAPAGAYTRVDRMGMPAVNTALITSGNKDAYNFADPAVDVGGAFVDDIVGSLQFFHGALDDDLVGFGLTPCSAPGDSSDVSECVVQGAPLILPDTLKIDPAVVAGFPNGRLLADPVIDVTLAVILLDVAELGNSAGPDSVTTLAGLPLNPPANDKSFNGTFPHVANPH